MHINGSTVFPIIEGRINADILAGRILNHLKINYDFESNVVDLNGSLFTTDTTAVINEVEGQPIEKIYISTTNYKNNSYDREFIFVVTEAVHKDLGKDLEYYLDDITNELAQYKGWTNKGGFSEYKVIFKNLN